jgi:leader peptidase (prepilin peptidase)/N-methyltransferase
MVLIGVFIGLLGLLIGSFLNVCIYRIPEGKSIAFPPSACTACGHRLSAPDLIPVISFLALKGKCRYCGKKISFIYPLVELLTAALFVLLYLRFHFKWDLLIYMAFVSLLVIAAFVDLKLKIIPDEVVIGIAVLGVVKTLFELSNWFDHAAGFVAGGLPLLAIALFCQFVLKKEAMGGGDIKLMAASGLLIGWKLTLFTLVAGVVLGAAVCIILLAVKKAGRKDMISFGPFLAAGAVCALFFGNELIGWYLSLFIR